MEQMKHITMQGLFWIKNYITPMLFVLISNASIYAGEECGCSCATLKNDKLVCEVLPKIQEALTSVHNKLEENILDLSITKKQVKKLEDIMLGNENALRNHNMEEVIVMKMENLVKSLCQKHIETMYGEDRDVDNNETKGQNERLDHMRTKRSYFSAIKPTDNKSEITKLKTQVTSLENDTNKQIQDLITRMDQFANLTEDLKLVTKLQSDVSGMASQLQRFKNDTEKQLEDLKSRMSQMENSTGLPDGVKNVSLPKTVLKFNGSERNESLTSLDSDNFRLLNLSSPNMQVSVEVDNGGNTRLVFGCQPLGKFVLVKEQNPWLCEGRECSGELPVCQRLLNKTEVADLASELAKESVCELGSSDVEDPTDCSKYFTCISGKLHRKQCSRLLPKFSKSLSRCSFHVSECPEDTSEATARLRNLTPAIHVIPNKVNKETSRMATDDAGHLVIYKGQSFSLSCNYPDNRWGPANWTVDFFDKERKETSIKRREDTNQAIVDVNHASEKDSGIYTCRTPFGKYHSITVDIRVVKCVVPETSLLKISGQLKDLTFSVKYPCGDGREVKAYCKANGQWSRLPPTEEECRKVM